MEARTSTYDTVVIGAGLGGLLAAAVAVRAGQRVLVVERMPYLGGRFTTVDQEGFAITTGALHLAPHGHGGPLARMLAALGTPTRWVQRDVIASVIVGGRHVVWRHLLDVPKVVGPRGKVDMLRMAAELAVVGHKALRFDAWLADRTADPVLRALFERFTQFALSIQPDQISYDEMRAVFRSVARYGLPQAPAGGCQAVIGHLAAYVQARGGEIRTMTAARTIGLDAASGRVACVTAEDRRTGAVETITASRVVSDAGPEVTARLLDRPQLDLAPPQAGPGACGLKLHIVSDTSLIPHNGIMFCLDTQRISGIVEVSRSVPAVAPPGMHMLDTFQVLMSDDSALERRLAVEDLRQVFGPAYDRHCRIVRASSFRGAWPVNHAIQGRDAASREPVPGLIMVGDAYKPSGHMMVEGVAASVQRVAPLLATAP
ncbi:MAG: hypothetical protein QOF51_865 [Chloroflexota bacterium]|jgi:phytoene dehydrogenase-like protein|nr:hypothetical protein [Chloroflexota bacterium]